MKNVKNYFLMAVVICLQMIFIGCKEQEKAGGSPVNGGAVLLFDGTDFSYWIDLKGNPVQWKIIDNAMEVAPKTGSIVTKQNFQDFKLHLEFSVPKTPAGTKHQDRGNSGVYIQRRYEVQILDSYGLKLGNNDCGAIYKFKPPDSNACKKPGRWQSYDITFHAPRFEKQGEDFKKVKNARITVLHNGVTIHDDVEIPNKTGLGQPEGPEPGPILLQDHFNKVRFRNIRIVPLN
jgi:hypothetical protein